MFPYFRGTYQIRSAEISKPYFVIKIYLIIIIKFNKNVLLKYTLICIKFQDRKQPNNIYRKALMKYNFENN